MKASELHAHTAATTASFLGTLAFARLALAMLFVAGFVGWGWHGVPASAYLWVIVATAFAYVAQQLFTLGANIPGAMLQVIAVGCAAVSFITLAGA